MCVCVFFSSLSGCWETPSPTHKNTVNVQFPLNLTCSISECKNILFWAAKRSIAPRTLSQTQLPRSDFNRIRITKSPDLLCLQRPPGWLPWERGESPSVCAGWQGLETSELQEANQDTVGEMTKGLVNAVWLPEGCSLPWKVSLRSQ